MRQQENVNAHKISHISLDLSVSNVWNQLYLTPHSKNVKNVEMAIFIAKKQRIVRNAQKINLLKKMVNVKNAQKKPTTIPKPCFVLCAELVVVSMRHFKLAPQ